MKTDKIIEDTNALFFDELKKHVRPEFLNRIDDVIMFTPLSREDIRDIVEINLGIVAKRLLKSNIELSWTNRALSFVSEVGFDPQFGARPIKRVIQKEILNKLSKDILANIVNAEAKIVLDFVDGQILFKNEIVEKTENLDEPELN